MQRDKTQRHDNLESGVMDYRAREADWDGGCLGLAGMLIHRSPWYDLGSVDWSTTPGDAAKMAPFDAGFPLFVARADNGTVTLPPGATNHGNPNLLCLPTKWTDIAIFILGNYVAHATTVVLPPGNSLFTTICRTAAAVLGAQARRSLSSCALLTHRELSFVFSLGASLPPFLPNQVTLQLHSRCSHELRTLSETFHTIRVVVFAIFTPASSAARGYRAIFSGQSLLPPISKRQPVQVLFVRLFGLMNTPEPFMSSVCRAPVSRPLLSSWSAKWQPLWRVYKLKIL